MASTYTNILRLELMADGENSNTWGQKANTVFQLAEDAIAGMASVAVTTLDVTLSTANGSTDEARKAIIKVTGTKTANRNLIVPAKSKRYVVWNAGTDAFTLTVKTSAGTGIVVPKDMIVNLVCDGTNVYEEVSDRDKIGKKSMWIPAGAMYPVVTGGCAPLVNVEASAGKSNMSVLDFDASTDESAEFDIVLPKSWNAGTITYQVYWLCSTANSTVVVWNLAGVCLSDNEAIDATFGTAVAVSDANQGSANRQLISAESGAVTLGGTPAKGERAVFRITRDADNASDTMAVDARLIGVRLFFTTDAGNDA